MERSSCIKQEDLFLLFPLFIGFLRGSFRFGTYLAIEKTDKNKKN